MARIRSIKPNIWSDARFIELSRDARLLFVGMISNADDDGRIVASGHSLAGAVFPHDDLAAKKVEEWRQEIAEQGLIKLYTRGKGTYAQLVGWSKHQIIRKRTPSSLPDPPKGGPGAAPGDALGTAPGASLGQHKGSTGADIRAAS